MSPATAHDDPAGVPTEIPPCDAYAVEISIPGKLGWAEEAAKRVKESYIELIAKSEPEAACLPLVVASRTERFSQLVFFFDRGRFPDPLAAGAGAAEVLKFVLAKAGIKAAPAAQITVQSVDSTGAIASRKILGGEADPA